MSATVSPPAPEAAPPAPTKSAPGRTRRIIAAVCLVVSCILAPLIVVTTWAKNEILSTDKYVSTVAPLVNDQALTDYVAERVTTQLAASVNVDEIVRNALPERAAFLAGPLSTGITTVVSDVTHRALASDQFRTIWKEANRTAHEQVRQALTGDGKNVKLENGKVVLDLSALLATVRTNLDQRGITIFNRLPAPSRTVKIELFDAKGLVKARRALRLLIAVRIALIVLFVGLFALGLYLSGDRRRSLARWGLGLAVALGVVGISITFGRGYVLDHLGANAPPRAATAGVIDQVTHYLRMGLRAGMVVGLLVAAAATLAGPGRVATRIRAITTSALQHSPTPAAGPFPVWVAVHRNLLIGIGVTLALLAVIAGLTPGPGAVLVAALLLLLWVAVVEIIARAAGPQDTEARVPDRVEPGPVTQ